MKIVLNLNKLTLDTFTPFDAVLLFSSEWVISKAYCLCEENERWICDFKHIALKIVRLRKLSQKS